MFKPDEYVVGGTVQAGDGLYVEREADQELLVLCRTRAFVYILSTRQVGKSSLIIHAAKSLAAEGITPVIIDLQESGVHEMTADIWYIGFLTEIADQLMLDVDVESWWNERHNLPHGKRFTTFFKEIVLDQMSGAVVVFVDEIDTTRRLPFADDFYTAIRSIYNSRALVPEFQRLSFVLVGAASPTDLIRDTKRTPFNIGQRVEVTDFTFNETLPLATRLGLSDNASRELTNQVLSWTSGHPYLTLALFRKIAEGVETGKRDWTEKDVEAIVQQNFFGGEEDSNLRFVRDMLTIHAPDPEQVLTTYREVYREKKPVADEERSPIKGHLKLAGVVRSENSDLRVRNRIYRQTFDAEWIRKHLPVNWPRRLQRAASVAVALFFIGLLPLSIFAWSQMRRAENALQAESEARLKAEQAAQNEAKARKIAEDLAKREAFARQAAQLAADSEAIQRVKAEQSAGAEKKARIQATEAAARERAASHLAEERRKVAEEAVFREEAAKLAAQKAEADARKAEAEAKKAKEQSEARGQVAFARQLVIQAEAELEKNDTASASAFFANALLLDDLEDTRSRLFGTLLQVARPLWTTRFHLDTPSQLALNADGSLLATLTDDREIVVSDTKTGTARSTISGFEGRGSTIVLDSTGRSLITISSELMAPTTPDSIVSGPTAGLTSRFTTYDVASGNKLNSVTYQTNDQSYAVSPDGKFAVVGGIDEKPHVLNLQTGKSQILPTSVEPPLFAYTFSPNGTLVAATKNNEVFLWDLRRNIEIRRFKDTSTSDVNNATSHVAFSADGKQILLYHQPSAGVTPQATVAALTVWDVADGELQGRLTLNEPIAKLAFTPNSSNVVLMIYTGKVLRWDIKTNRTDEIVRSGSGLPVAGGEFSQDGRKFAVSDDGRRFQVFSVNDMKLFGTVHISSKHVGHGASVSSIAFDPRGEFVASGGRDSRLILWNATTGALTRTLSEDVNIRSLSFSPDGTWLAYAGQSGNVHLWNRETDERKVLSPNMGPINVVAFSPTEPLLAAGGSNGEILMWTPKQESKIPDVVAETAPTTPPTNNPDTMRQAVVTMAFSRDGKWLAAVRNNDPGAVRFYSAETGDLLHTFRSGNDYFRSLAFGASGTFATAGRTGTVRLWQISPESRLSWVIQELQVLPGKFGSETTITVSPDGQRLALANQLQVASEARYQYSVRVWDLIAQQWLTSVRGGFDAVGVQFSPDGRFLAAGATDGTVRLWEVKDSSPFSFPDRFNVTALSTDGELMASVEREGSESFIVVRSVKEGRMLERLPAEISPFSLVAFSPDNKWLAATSDTSTSSPLRVWDRTTKKLVHNVSLVGVEISDLKFSPDSRVMIVAARTNRDPKNIQNKAVLYDLQSGKPSEIPFAGGALWSIAISPDGKWLVMGGGGSGPTDPKQKTIIVWDLTTNRQAFSWQGKNGAVLSLAFSGEQGKDNNEWVIASGEGNGPSNSADETLRLIDFKTRKQLRTFPEFIETVSGIDFCPRSSGYNLLVTAGQSYRVWNLDTNSGGLVSGLTLSRDGVTMRPSIASNGRFLMAAARGEIRSWDLKQMSLIMNSQPEEVVSYVRGLTLLNVHGLEELGFARLTQDQLRALLGTSYRSNFTVVQMPPTGQSAGTER